MSLRRGYATANYSRKFANRRNSHCVTMASLEHANLANSLMCKAFHSSLGSAMDFNSLSSEPALGSKIGPILLRGGVIRNGHTHPPPVTRILPLELLAGRQHSTSGAGTRCARRAIGPGTASKPPCGPSRAAARTPRRSTPLKSRWNACAGRC